jgi:hypothetical protein
MTPHLEAEILRVLPQLQGWCTPQKAFAEAALITDNKLMVAVEIGVFGGSSLLPKALAMRETGGRVYGIDPWHVVACEDDDNGKANNEWWAKVDLNAIHNGCVAKLWELGLNDRAVLIRGQSQDCHGLFGAIDLLEIDGNHSETASCRDVELYLPKVRKGGYIVFDDYDWVSTRKAAEMIERECDTVMPGGGKFMIYKKR